MIKRLFVIGDSFTVPCQYTKGWNDSTFWIEVLGRNFELNDGNVIVDGMANRDVQTIIDNWIKLLPHLTKEDRVVICIPYFRRSRLPLVEECWHKSYKPYPKEINIINRFAGPQMIDNNMKSEYWGDTMSSSQLMDMMSNYEIMNSSTSAQLNQIEIIETLIRLTPCSNFVFTWDTMEYKTEYIADKVDLTNTIGFWQTLNDEWYETNGEVGQQLDFHWGSKFNVSFGDYLFTKLKNT